MTTTSTCTDGNEISSSSDNRSAWDEVEQNVIVGGATAVAAGFVAAGSLACLTQGNVVAGTALGVTAACQGVIALAYGSKIYNKLRNIQVPKL